MANTKYLGRKFLVKVGTGSPTAYATVANMKSTSFALQTEEINVTDKDGDGWRELLEGGIQSGDITLAGFISNHSTLKTTLLAAAAAGSILPFKLVSDLGDSWTGPFQVQSCERTGENPDAEGYTLKLASSSKVTYTPAS